MTSRTPHPALPPGQRELIGVTPRFGLPRHLRTRFAIPALPEIEVGGLRNGAATLGRAELAEVPQTTQTLDMHCVMTWSAVGTRWTGWYFDELWDRLLAPQAGAKVTHLVFGALDGAVASKSPRTVDHASPWEG